MSDFLGPRIIITVFVEGEGFEEFEFYVLDVLALLLFFGSQIFYFFNLAQQIF